MNLILDDLLRPALSNESSYYVDENSFEDSMVMYSNGEELHTEQDI